MTDPKSYRPPPGDIPQRPGVYRFRDEHGHVLYVGKATSLRSRLSSYFADPSGLHPRTYAMVHAATSVDWLVVSNEVEALALEYQWIKEFDPRFNVKYRDDKSYPFVSVSLADQFPRVAVVREAKRKGNRYFGPYAHAWAIRETVDELLRVFPMRSCRDGVFKAAVRSGRPCLLGYIGKCCAPCVGSVTPEEHRLIAEEFCAFMSGTTEPFTRALQAQMRDASGKQDYEEAARLRDRIEALNRALERNAVVLPTDTDADIIGITQDELECGVQVLKVRNGRVSGEQGLIVEKAEDLSQGGYVDRILQRLYGEDSPSSIPKEVLVSLLPEHPALWESLLTSRRGAQVRVRVPRRGDKAALLATAVSNAEHNLARHRSRRSQDLKTRSQAIEELRVHLGLSEAPLRIECIDISTLQGQDTVASLVVFEDGLPKKRDYRTYGIRGAGADDVAAVREVVARRFRDGTSASAYPPGLLVVDGGQPQVRAAHEALSGLGLSDVPVVGLAKRLEEAWRPDDPDPVILPRTSEGLYLLQRVRDEAHRVAIGLHRQRRGRRARSSALDGIPGLGPTKAAALLKHFGSVRRVRQASTDELMQVPGIGSRLAEAIQQSLAGSSS